jgi:hypothetical protein
MGGAEGAIFTAELQTMYTRYCQDKGWQVAVVSRSESEAVQNGPKGATHVTLEVKGEGAYGMLRWEGGVHCVIRVPSTEKAGRVHTSTTAMMVSRQNPPLDLLPLLERAGLRSTSLILPEIGSSRHREPGCRGSLVRRRERSQVGDDAILWCRWTGPFLSPFPSFCQLL